MKKILTSVLTALLGLTLLSTPVMAASAHQPLSTIEKPVIQDRQILYENAKKGITDVNLKPQSAKLKNSQTKQEKEIKVLSTTQLAKEIHYSDGQVERKYVTTNFADVTKGDLLEQMDKIVPENIIPGVKQVESFTIQSIARGDEKWDSSISVRAYSTIYWSYVGTKLKLDYVTGGWENQDSSIGIKDRYVILAQTDAGFLNQWIDGYLSQNNYTWYALSGWQPVQNTGGTTVGSTEEANIYELINPSSTWGLYLSNNLPTPW